MAYQQQEGTYFPMMSVITPASFYKVFSPEEAFRLPQKLEIYYTPKRGSWLDIAEIELSALTIQCLLGERIPSVDSLNQILKSWSLT